MDDIVQIGRRISGPAGKASEVLMHSVRPLHVDQTGTLATWFLDCPGQAAVWRCYGLSIVHLRPIPGESRPARLAFPGATHEMILVAFDPDESPEESRPRSWRILSPLNVSHQVILPSDAAAVMLLGEAAREIVFGRLWAEPPLSGATEPWTSWLNAWSEMSRRRW